MIAVMSKRARAITLTVEQRQSLEERARSRSEPHHRVQRAQLILAAAAGESNSAIAARLGMSRQMVGIRRKRFQEAGLAGLEDQPRSGRPRVYSEEDRIRVLETACTKKPEAESHWSIRRLAEATGIGRHVVHQVLREAKLQPHRVGTFSVSNDPDFAAKVIDVVGLYLHPPEHALVLSVDEKTQVQALDRTQPMLPMRPGQFERRTHDYKRNGTIQLYAALEVHAGRVVPRVEERHRSREFIAFMEQLLKAYPHQPLHIIVDNVSSHHSQEVENWHRQPHAQRITFHFVPTYSSWMNLVEVFFNLLQAKVLRRGIFPSKRSLVQAILAYVGQFSQEGKPFHWTKSAQDILRAVSTPIYGTGH